MKRLKFLTVFVVILTVLALVLSSCGSSKGVIAEFRGKKIMLSDYNLLIDFNARLCEEEFKQYILDALRFASFLESKNVKISNEQFENAELEIKKEYFYENSLLEDYLEIANSAKIDYNILKTSLKYYSRCLAARKEFYEYANSTFVMPDNAEESEDILRTRHIEALEAEAKKQEVSIKTSGTSSINGVYDVESVYLAATAFSVALNKANTVKAISLYYGINFLYGKNADLTTQAAYLETIKDSLKTISGIEVILKEMQVDFDSFFNNAQNYYKNVFVYEQLTQKFFEEEYHLKKTAGVLPKEVESYENYVEYILLLTASECKINLEEF